MDKVEQALNKLMAQYSELSRREGSQPSGGKERLLDWLELKTSYESLSHELKNEMVERINAGD